METQPLTPPRSAPAGPEPGKLYETRRAVLLSAVFLCVAAVGVWHHEMWRDEWQAWMLARDSGSIAELLGHLRSEGHFAAWYLVLFGLSRFTRDPVAMQAMHLLIAVGSVYLLARYAPLPWPQKVLAAFGYFLAYDYAVIARHYSLTVFALFAFCALFPRRRRHPVAVGAALALLATTSIHGTILAGAAVGMLLMDASTSRTGDRSVRPRWARAGLVAWVVLVGAGLVLTQLWTPPGLPDAVGSATNRTFSPWALASTASRLTTAYLPIPDLASTSLWGTTVLPSHTSQWLGVRLIIAVLLAGGATLLFLRTPLILAFFLIATGGILLFSHLVFSGFLRHHGHLFVVFLACLWLAGYREREWRPPPPLDRWAGVRTRWGAVFVTAVLLAQVVAAAILYTADIRRPFSAAPQAAEFIRAEGLADLPMAGSPAPATSSVAGILDRPIHYIGVEAPGTFVRWGRYARRWDRNFGMRHLRPFLENRTSDVVVILGRPFDDWDPELHVEELARFPAGLVANEGFVLYRVRVTRAMNS